MIINSPDKELFSKIIDLFSDLLPLVGQLNGKLDFIGQQIINKDLIKDIEYIKKELSDIYNLYKNINLQNCYNEIENLTNKLVSISEKIDQILIKVSNYNSNNLTKEQITNIISDTHKLIVEKNKEHRKWWADRWFKFLAGGVGSIIWLLGVCIPPYIVYENAKENKLSIQENITSEINVLKSENNNIILKIKDINNNISNIFTSINELQSSIKNAGGK